MSPIVGWMRGWMVASVLFAGLTNGAALAADVHAPLAAPALSTPEATAIMAGMNANRFPGVVEQLEKHPFDESLLPLRDALPKWVNDSPSVLIMVGYCPDLKPWYDAKDKDLAAALLLNQFYLETFAYQMSSPSMSVADRQTESMKGALRMYLLLKTRGAQNAFAEKMLAAVDAKGSHGLDPYTCVATKPLLTP